MKTENISIVKEQGAQGDVMFRRIAALPEGVVPSAAEKGAFVVAHSETGHNHVVMERPGVTYYSGMDALRAYLVVEETVEDGVAPVEHLREHDTHGTIGLTPGVWEVRRQREYTPQGFRRAAD